MHFIDLITFLALPAAFITAVAADPAPSSYPTAIPTTLSTTKSHRAPPPPACTTTVVVFPPPLDLSQTKTVYKYTVTTTTYVNCSGCALQTFTMRFGPGPVIPGGITKTTTLNAATTVPAFSCSAKKV